MLQYRPARPFDVLHEGDCVFAYKRMSVLVLRFLTKTRYINPLLNPLLFVFDHLKCGTVPIFLNTFVPLKYN